MPTSDGSLSAVVVSGGKQYRVSPGDRILVDRTAGEPGSEITLDRVLLLVDGDEVKVGVPGVDGATVTARVIGPARGPKIDVLRYKSKKRVRVHRGARAGLTALEILTVGGRGGDTAERTEKTEKASEKPSAKAPRKPARPRAAVAAEPETAAEEPKAEARPARRTRTARPSAEETGDGA